MKFSLFFEIQIHDPTPAREAAAFHESLAQAELAEKCGYHCVWAVEHHGLREYSHSSAPEIFLSFVAARTSRIRVGHGVTLLPYRYNHPIRIAERIATLDILSNGRVNWGSGKSSSRTEQGAFEADPALVHDQWLEAVSIIPQMWSSEVFEYKGRHFNIPPTQVIPKPLQQPHPPMYAACSQPASAVLAGELGLGALNFGGGPAQLERAVQDYRRAAARAQPVGRAATNAYACVPCGLVLDDDRKACAYGLGGAMFFQNAMSAYYYGGNRPIGSLRIPAGPLPDEYIDAARSERHNPASPISATLCGDPVYAREAVQRYVNAGVDELILVMQAGGVPHEIVQESIRTFAEKVMPHFT